MKFKLFILASIATLIISCKGQTDHKYQSVAPKAFAEKIDSTPNPQIFDVRTPEEYMSEHIEGAENINWNGSDFEQQAAKFDKIKPVFVYCMSGGRSRKAAEKLSEMGFTKIYELDGGYLKWGASGLTLASNKTVGISPVEFEKLLNTNKEVLVDFYAEWCPPCKKMSPYITKMQSELTDKVEIVRLDADKNKTIAMNLKIEALPTLLLYKDKKIIWQNTGYISEEELKKHLN